MNQKILIELSEVLEAFKHEPLKSPINVSTRTVKMRADTWADIKTIATHRGFSIDHLLQDICCTYIAVKMPKVVADWKDENSQKDQEINDNVTKAFAPLDENGTF